MVTRQDDRPRDDMSILNRACRMFGKKVGNTPYTGLTIKEALAYIGYPDVKLDTKA